jgi:pimeloyl-ACP methyl ester carboxylesterase
MSEVGLLMAQLPLLRLTEPGGTGPVMVLPGFMADDTPTWLLRRFLDMLGYRSYPWGGGVNRGRALDHLPGLRQKLVAMAEQWGAPASLVGWSRGGILARELARDDPALVRSVVTLGTPVRGGVHGTSIGRWVSRETGLTPEQLARLLEQRAQRSIEVPITAVYSRTDGVVAWQSCIDETNPHVRHQQVDSSHLGLVANARVYRHVAAALARYHATRTGSADRD